MFKQLSTESARVASEKSFRAEAQKTPIGPEKYA